MTKPRKRKCRNCKEYFPSDYRNLRHQHYCSKTKCRKASRASSQRRWVGKSVNRKHFSGQDNVKRVQEWRKTNHGYSKGIKGPKVRSALQDDCIAQTIETKQETSDLNGFALQEDWFCQSAVFIGLLANLIGSSLQENIAEYTQKLILLGYDIINDIQSQTGGKYDKQTSINAGKATNGSSTVAATDKWHPRALFCSQTAARNSLPQKMFGSADSH